MVWGVPQHFWSVIRGWYVLYFLVVWDVLLEIALAENKEEHVMKGFG